MLPLANGLKLAKIEELTQTNVIKAALSEIPCVIMECYTDAGALPTERSPGNTCFTHLNSASYTLFKIYFST